MLEKFRSEWQLRHSHSKLISSEISAGDRELRGSGHSAHYLLVTNRSATPVLKRRVSARPGGLQLCELALSRNASMAASTA